MPGDQALQAACVASQVLSTEPVDDHLMSDLQYGTCTDESFYKGTDKQLINAFGGEAVVLHRTLP